MIQRQTITAEVHASNTGFMVYWDDVRDLVEAAEAYATAEGEEARRDALVRLMNVAEWIGGET